MLVINDQISIPLREFQFTYSRSGGPGGQNVNKVNSRVQLHWDLSKTTSVPADILVRLKRQHKRRISADDQLYLASQRFRDQGRNVADVLNKLAEMIRAAAIPPKKRKPTRITPHQKQRRLDNKRRQSEKKQGRKMLD